jgi:hypothetical protein
MKAVSIILIFLFCTFSLQAQCYSKNKTFKDGEDISFTVWYKLGFIWLEAGKARFVSDSTTYNNKPAWHIKSYGTSLEDWDNYFKVRDYYEVYMEQELLRPLEFTRKTNEAGWAVYENFKFDHQNQTVYSITEHNKKPRTFDTLAMKACAQDLLSAIIYARNFDYQSVSVNQKVPMMIIMDAEFYPLYLRYLGKEQIEDRNNNKYNCLKFKVMLVEGTMFNAGENMTVWVTDDGNRVPVLIQADILIGSIKAYLTSYKNLKHPFDAKVK